jgi:CRISPR-associated protein Cas1
MAWRGLHLTNPSRLSLADNQIVVSQSDGVVRLAIEDVAWIVLDTTQSTLTGALLSACMSAGVALIVTDETHTPSGVALPFHSHFRQGEIAHRQIATTTPFKKRLWQKIVRAKIKNQSAALSAVGRSGADALTEMSRNVASGDPRNIEARAARYYWGQLWEDFRRDDDSDRRNKMLNYGYAVVRSGVARSLVAAGLIPAFGVKHASVSNAFNLADDLFEPFRPFVDVLAWKTADEGAPSRAELSIDDRRAMAGALMSEATMGLEIISLLSAAEKTAKSLVRAIMSASPDALDLPALTALTPSHEGG